MWFGGAIFLQQSTRKAKDSQNPPPKSNTWKYALIGLDVKNTRRNRIELTNTPLFTNLIQIYHSSCAQHDAHRGWRFSKSRHVSTAHIHWHSRQFSMAFDHKSRHSAIHQDLLAPSFLLSVLYHFHSWVDHGHPISYPKKKSMKLEWCIKWYSIRLPDSIKPFQANTLTTTRRRIFHESKLFPYRKQRRTNKTIDMLT